MITVVLSPHFFLTMLKLLCNSCFGFQKAFQWKFRWGTLPPPVDPKKKKLKYHTFPQALLQNGLLSLLSDYMERKLRSIYEVVDGWSASRGRIEPVQMHTHLFHLCFTILPTCRPSLWWGQCIIDTVVCIYRAGGGFCKQAKVTSRYGTKCGILPVPIFKFFSQFFS